MRKDAGRAPVLLCALQPHTPSALSFLTEKRFREMIEKSIECGLKKTDLEAADRDASQTNKARKKAFNCSRTFSPRFLPCLSLLFSFFSLLRLFSFVTPMFTQLFVLPETLGTWLVLLGSPSFFARLPSMTLALVFLLLSHPLAFVLALWQQWPRRHHFGLIGVITRAVFFMRAPAVLSSLLHTFKELARKHNAYIVAGSAFLPKLRTRKEGEGESLTRYTGCCARSLSLLSSLFSPCVRASLSACACASLCACVCALHPDTSIDHTSTDLFNVALTFSPAGEVCLVTYKLHLTPDEYFLDCGDRNTVTTECESVRACVRACFVQTYLCECVRVCTRVCACGGLYDTH